MSLVNVSHTLVEKRKTQHFYSLFFRMIQSLFENDYITLVQYTQLKEQYIIRRKPIITENWSFMGNLLVQQKLPSPETTNTLIIGCGTHICCSGYNTSTCYLANDGLDHTTCITVDIEPRMSPHIVCFIRPDDMSLVYFLRKKKYTITRIICCGMMPTTSYKILQKIVGKDGVIILYTGTLYKTRLESHSSEIVLEEIQSL